MSFSSISGAPGINSTNSSSPTPDNNDTPIEVFVVDDHPAIRDVIASKAADREKMEVAGTSGKASEGLTAIEERRPDVVVLDISLDGIDGLTLTRTIRSETPDTRVLVFSIYKEPIYAKLSIRAGASGYLPKSKPIAEVMDAIRSINEGGYHLRQDILSDLLDETLRVDKTPEELGVEGFTDREMTVFQMLGGGDTVPQIADHLGLSRKTVETYRRGAKRKLGCDTVHELIRYAVLWKKDGERLTSA